MMELIPEKISGAVVFSARKVCPKDDDGCQLCSDFAIGVHNWLVAYDVPYVIIDFGDEKEVCSDLIVELLQLRKRLKCPFFFAGVMDRPRKVLVANAYSPGSPIFSTPEDAVAEIVAKFPQLLSKSHDGIPFGQPLMISRPRPGLRGEPGVEAESSDEPAEPDEP